MRAVHAVADPSGWRDGGCGGRSGGLVVVVVVVGHHGPHSKSLDHNYPPPSLGGSSVQARNGDFDVVLNGYSEGIENEENASKSRSFKLTECSE